MITEFNLRKKREELFETELVGKTINAGRIFRKIIAQDREFLRLLKEDHKRLKYYVKCQRGDLMPIFMIKLNRLILEIIENADKLAGSQLTK